MWKNPCKMNTPRRWDELGQIHRLTRTHTQANIHHQTFVSFIIIFAWCHTNKVSVFSIECASSDEQCRARGQKIYKHTYIRRKKNKPVIFNTQRHKQQTFVNCGFRRPFFHRHHWMYAVVILWIFWLLFFLSFCTSIHHRMHQLNILWEISLPAALFSLFLSLVIFSSISYRISCLMPKLNGTFTFVLCSNDQFCICKKIKMFDAILNARPKVRNKNHGWIVIVFITIILTIKFVLLYFTWFLMLLVVPLTQQIHTYRRSGFHVSF